MSAFVILVPKRQTLSDPHQSKYKFRATGRHTSDMTSFISTLMIAQTPCQLEFVVFTLRVFVMFLEISIYLH